MDILYALEKIRTPFWNGVMSAVTQLGGEVIFIVAAVVVFWCVSKWEGYYLMTIAFCGTVLNQFLKLVCRVPRPWVRDPNFTIVESARAEATGYSFPSGHTQNAVGTFGGIARATKRHCLRWVCVVIFVLVSFSRMYLGVHTPLVIAFSRMYLGVHTPADVGVSLVLAAALVLFIVVRMAAVTFEQPQPRGDEYAEYETGVVTDILSDSTEADTVADGGYRGEQLLLAQVRSGQYKGETMQGYNYVGPLYGQPLKVGQRAVLLISTYSDGSHTATVYEYDRAVGLAVIVGLFLLAAVLVGGKVGAKSLVALAVTLVCLFWILIPLLMKGASTLLTVFLVCAYITVVTMVILGGVCRKTVCAALGTVAGTALALLFGLLSQSLLRIDGLRLTDVEPLLQLRQTGTPLGLRGLLVAGVVISALGAVMDVAMSISSALTEVHTVAPDRDGRALFRSGMNIGRDMVGTMTNTLILAFLGSGLSFIIYLYSLGLDPRQLISSPYMATEVISGIASSIGVILAVPLTALITSFILVKDKKPKAPCGSKPEDKKLPKEVQ